MEIEGKVEGEVSRERGVQRGGGKIKVGNI